MQAFKFILLSLLALSLVGCAKERVVYQRVNVPVRCDLVLPKKPKSADDFNTHKKLMLYFLEVESIAKACTKGDSDE